MASQRVTRRAAADALFRTSAEQQWQLAATAPRLAQPAACHCERLLADELLLVLQLLSPDELLACRAVCARWRRVASTRTLFAALDFAAASHAVKPRALAALLRLAGVGLRMLDLRARSCGRLSGRDLLAALEDNPAAAVSCTRLQFSPVFQSSDARTAEEAAIQARYVLSVDELARLGQLCPNLDNESSLKVGVFEGRDLLRLRLPAWPVHTEILLCYALADEHVEALEAELTRVTKEAVAKCVAAARAAGEEAVYTLSTGPTVSLDTMHCSMSHYGRRVLGHALLFPTACHTFYVDDCADMVMVAEALSQESCVLITLFVMLDGTPISDEAWAELASALAVNTRLALLCVAGHIAVSATSAAALAAALRANSSLERLNLAHANLAEVPAPVLAELRADPRVALP
jgi:hypothetical protein